MSSQGESQQTGSPERRRRPPPPPPKPRKVAQASSSKPRPAIPSKYLINDIPRGTTSVKLFNFLVAPPHYRDEDDDAMPAKSQPQVQFSCVITDSRLDDELSVAVFEFMDTPKWLRCVNRDPFGFPKKTPLGTLWRGVSMTELDAQGQTEFIRAAIDDNPVYAETLAEFSDTDVNVQDIDGRTALHWACVKSLRDIVMLCLSIPGCDVGLRDKANLTAFDLARQTNDEVIPNLFYKNMIELDESDPQAALLRVLTMTSEPMTDKAIFPGEAIFDPVEDRNTALVEALIHRGVDLTARNSNGDTALHLAAAQVDNVDIATKLLEAGSDINAIGAGGATPLHHAARSADEEMVHTLLHWKADVAVKDHDAQTPLHWAMKNGQSDAEHALLEHVIKSKAEGKNQHIDLEQNDLEVELMDGSPLERGADVEPVDESKYTATVHTDLESTEQNDLEVELMDGSMASGQEAEAVEKQNEVEQTPRRKKEAKYDGAIALHQAAAAGNLEVVLVLLKWGADVEAVDKSKYTALHWAATNGHTETVTALLAKGANTEAAAILRQTALYQAAGRGHTETVTALLAGGANIEAADHIRCTALLRAASSGHTETVTALLAKGANIEAASEYGQTALYQAADRGHTETVTALLARGANIEVVDQYGWTALLKAAHSGHTETVTALLAKGANIEAAGVDGYTALLRAAYSGHTEMVTALLAEGANIEAADQNGWTALNLAVRRSHTDTVTALLAGGANIEAADRDGQTALYQAADRGHTETVTALLAKGANIEAADQRGWTALHGAAISGRTETATALLAKGANIEAADRDGWKALHNAAASGHLKLVEIFLANKADMEAKCDKGTALQLALRERHAEVAKTLVAHGAQITAAGRVQLTVLPLRRSKKHQFYT